MKWDDNFEKINDYNKGKKVLVNYDGKKMLVELKNIQFDADNTLEGVIINLYNKISNLEDKLNTVIEIVKKGI